VIGIHVNWGGGGFAETIKNNVWDLLQFDWNVDSIVEYRAVQLTKIVFLIPRLIMPSLISP